MIESLFHYLWSEDELDGRPQINIPDTIVYKYRQPALWYFTAKDGRVKKKSKYNLVNVRIEEAFTRNSLGCDIVAYYISTPEAADGACAASAHAAPAATLASAVRARMQGGKGEFGGSNLPSWTSPRRRPARPPGESSGGVCWDYPVSRP